MSGHEFEPDESGVVNFNGASPNEVDLTSYDSVIYQYDPEEFEPPDHHSYMGKNQRLVEDATELNGLTGDIELVEGNHTETRDKALKRDEIPRWEDVKQWFESDSNGSTTQGYATATDILCFTQSFAAIRETGALYYYDPGRGYYLRKGETYINELLEKEIPECLNESRKRNIREKIRDRNLISSNEFNPPTGKVNLENGVLDLDTNELEPHNPAYYFTSQIHAAWPENGDIDPHAEAFWTRALTNATNDRSEQQKIEEFIGYTLETWHHDREKNLFLIGPPLSGKSTIQEAIEALFGQPPTVTNLTPQQIADTQFDAASLREAALNTVNDINARKIEDTGTLKRVFSGERMKLENKFEDADFGGPNTKHLFTANWLPRLVGQDDAVYRRVLLVEFTNPIPDSKKDPAYKKRLQTKQVQQAILNRAVDARERLHTQDGFTNDRSPNDTRKLWDSWRDGHKRFLYTQFTITGNPEHEVDRESYWRAYREYAGRNGFELKSNRAITNSLQYVPEVYTTGQSDTYGGLKWNDTDAAESPTENEQTTLETQEQKVTKIQSIIREQTTTNDHIDVNTVIDAADIAGISREDTDHIIQKLLTDGELYEPESGVISRV